MYCGNCGNEIDDNVNFCPVCGKKIKHKANFISRLANQLSDISGKKVKPFVIVLWVALAAVVFIVGGIFVDIAINEIFYGNKSDYSYKESVSPNNIDTEDTGNNNEGLSFNFSKADNGILPSPDDFFDGQLLRKRDEDGYWDNSETGMVYVQGWQITFKSDADGIDAFHDYAELIGSGNYALSLVDKIEKTVSYMRYTYYIYECDGDDDPVQSIFRTSSRDEEKKGDLIVAVNYNGNDGTSILEILFDPNYFSFKKSKKTYSGTLNDMSGVSSSDGGGTISSSGSNYGSSLECSFCDGEGDCSECDGWGYVYSINGKRDKNCTKCNTTGDCTYCGGTGNRY